MLFNIRDPDRPMFVVAESYIHALDKWRALCVKENEGTKLSDHEPQGIQMIAEDGELLL